jgi:hypothetical protein
MLGKQESAQSTPLYVSVVSHNEEDERRFGSLDTREGYLEFRESLLKFAHMLKRYGAKYNWQSEMRFLRAVERFDKSKVLESTNGKNIVRYLKEDLGFEVDPHSHETGYIKSEAYNYADVAYMFKRLGVEPSKVVGGFIYWPPEIAIWEKFREPLRGQIYDYAWKAEILPNGAVLGHAGNKDDFSSGIWKPKDRYHFTEHDENSNLICVGSGYAFDTTGKWIKNLVSKIKSKELPQNKIYTATLLMIEDYLLKGGKDPLYPPAQFSFNSWENTIRELSEYSARGEIVWAGLTEVVEIWKKKYNSIPNRYA